jgi:O-antigen/teichoic acid export membrane protein
MPGTEFSKYRKWLGALLVYIGILGLILGVPVEFFHLLFGVPSDGWRALAALAIGLPCLLWGSYWLEEFRRLKRLLITVTAVILTIIVLIMIKLWFHGRLPILSARGLGTIALCALIGVPCWGWLGKRGYLKSQRNKVRRS